MPNDDIMDALANGAALNPNLIRPIAVNPAAFINQVPMEGARWVLDAGDAIERVAGVRMFDAEMQPAPKRVIRNPVKELLADQYDKEGKPLPRKLGSHLGRAYDGLFGYELEVEGNNLPAKIAGWKTAKDGSLRGESAEYILSEPQTYENTIAAFEKLVKSLSAPATSLSLSYRTSTHIHVNVLEFTKAQIQAFFYLAHLVEDVLVHYCAPIRKGNRFCLRTKDADFKIDAFLAWLTKRGFPLLSEEQLKYSAINIATISKYGSVEFRSLHASVDTEVVLPWLSVLKNIHDIATIVPVNEMADIAKKNLMDILNVVFKGHLPKFQYTGMEQDVLDAYERLIEIPHAKVVL